MKTLTKTTPAYDLNRGVTVNLPKGTEVEVMGPTLGTYKASNCYVGGREFVISDQYLGGAQ